MLQKMTRNPHLSQLRLRWLLGIILGDISANPQIGNIYTD